MTSRSRTSLLAWCLTTVGALGVACQQSTQNASAPAAPVATTVTGPPMDQDRGESPDDAVAREQATLEWFGGEEPSAEYLAQKKALAQQELRRWADSFRTARTAPHRPAQPGIPDDDAAWTNIGPTGGLATNRPPGGGETEAGRLSIQGIVTHPTNARILYVSTASGGVWKTTQADPTVANWNWTPITDSLPNATSTGNLACGALAMSPTNPETLYLGLGDFWSSTGQGVYKTANGGTDWTELGTIGTTRRVLSILPVSESVILVGGDAGLWRSINGGTNFANIAINGDTGGSIWSIQQLSATRLILSRENRGGPNAGVGTLWYSTNAGANWSQAAVDVAQEVQNRMGRMTLAASPSSATVAYALVQYISTPYIFYLIPARDPEYFLNGLLRTTDGGQNWSWVESVSPTPFEVWRQSGYNQALAVSPNDTDLVFGGGNLSFWRSINRGRDWQQLTDWLGWTRAYMHADAQTMAFSKTGPLTLFVGNDGGLTVFPRPTAPFAEYPQGAGDVAPNANYVDNRHNVGIVSQMIYSIGSTNALNATWKVSIGLQDNGTRLRRGPTPGTTLYDETSTRTGDGIGTLYHKGNGRKLLISSYYAYIYRSTDDGATFVNTFWSSPYLFAPFYTRLHPGLFDASGNTIFTHTALGIYRSEDFGAQWALDTVNVPILSARGIRNFNVSKANALSRAMALGRLPALPSPSITVSGADSVTVSRLPDVSDLDLLITHDGGQNWIVPRNPPVGDANRRGPLSYVWFKTDNDDVLYITSVGLNTQEHHLFKSTNGGQDWVSLDGSPGNSNGFPYGIPVHVIKNDLTQTDVLLAGTDFGVYVSRNGGNNWARYGAGLPMVSVQDLYLAPDGSFVRAATYGRGVWEIGTPGPGEGQEN